MDAPLPKQLPQSPRPRFLDHLHHLLHLAELLHQAVHVLHLRARTSRDAAAAGGIQQVGVAAFLQRHRMDDGLGRFQILLEVFGVHLLGLFA